MMNKVNDLIIHERNEKVNNLKILKEDIKARLDKIAREYELMQDKLGNNPNYRI